MALVAYSDESDLSSDEEKVESYRNIPIPSGYKPANDFPSPQILNNRKITDASSNHEISSGVDSIEMDEDDDHMFAVPASKSNLKSPASLSLLSSLPAAIAAGASMAKLDLSDDELTDVPTKETWKPAQEILIKKHKWKLGQHKWKLGQHKWKLGQHKWKLGQRKWKLGQRKRKQWQSGAEQSPRDGIGLKCPWKFTAEEENSWW
ncbi:hypothetical protein HAZT_HAZT008265 [Hyalella azteca]|uniref:Uncharacterized protein n=1 Tax=Hyalella azteca TaxID=294128 RepID=A0A6A0HE60_HYAAZ|nr:hypothetical protein HAZT_HAZT008265 [Hyalella azteca]